MARFFMAIDRKLVEYIAANTCLRILFNKISFD